jgi:hypothetical protein
LDRPDQNPDLFVAGEVDANVSEALRGLVGSNVMFSAHHLPPNLEEEEVQKSGFGSCLAGDFCKAGHLENPYWLWDCSAQGLLEIPSEGKLSIGGNLFDLGDFLVGHYGRLAVCSVPEVPFEAGADDLVAEADELSAVLHALQNHLKADRDD